MPELSVIAPCFNEEANVERLAERVLVALGDAAIDGELVLVDDGSADGTWEVIERIRVANGGVVAVRHPTNKGITEAWTTGLETSSGEYVLTIDADMQYRPEDVPMLFRHARAHDLDIVQGWRRDYGDASALRKLLSRGLSGLLNVLFLRNVHDIKSGFAVYRRDVYRDVMADRGRFLTFQHFFILRALALGYTFAQLPIRFDPRMEGESFIQRPFLFSMKVLVDLPKALWLYGLKPRLGGRP